MTLLSRQTQVEEYYEELKDLPADFMRVYSLYQDQFDFRDCKRHSGMGDLLGIDIISVREILEKDYGFPPSVVTDYLRKIRLIDFVMTQNHNENAKAQQAAHQAATSSAKSGGTTILPIK